MSSVYTSSSTEDSYSLDRPLVVKCTFGQKKKRITFASARIGLDILRQKVEKCFSLFGTEYKIIWRDDDGENWPICEDNDLGDAISFFASEEPPPTSNASLLSGYSSSSSGRKITVHVTIQIDYDGPSLSETSSIASREEYDIPPSNSSLDYSQVSRSELEDDEVTVSSKDTRAQIYGTTSDTIHGIPRISTESDLVSVEPDDSSLADDTPTESQYISGPFERLKFDDPSVDVGPSSSILRSERGVAWLRDQTLRTIKSTLGALPEPSDKSNAVSGSQIDDSDLEISLQRHSSGKYYYSYNSGAPSLSDSGSDENSSIEGSVALPKYRPTSMELAWFESLEQGPSSRSRPTLHKGFNSDPNPFLDFPYSDIPPEVLPFITTITTIPQPDELTTCSQCDNVLDSIRYVCSTCKEKKSRSIEQIEISRCKGKGRNQAADFFPILYPPAKHQTSSFAANRSTNGYPIDEKPIPLLSDGTPDPGYELCPGCLESSGVDHALEMSLAPGSSPSPTSPENALSVWRRTAPTHRGQLRHAYLEKAWGLTGWQDVQQDELYDPRCSTCNSVIIGRRYKCASCIHFNLCIACYSQVHEIHPSHAFLVIDTHKSTHSRSDSGPHIPTSSESNDLPSMQHPGVKCAHCLLDIVGARFHCVVCSSVDICSNCESVGLPGNLDSSDGGHSSSHIMIKIPYPLESSKVQAASHQAMARWNGGDADNVQYAGSRTRSRRSSWDGTVRLDSTDLRLDQDHGIQCSGCSKPIIGTRYQCGNCPSLPQAYSLCSKCEERSYVIHDSTHAFFKFRRPVDLPIESTQPILPKLYQHRVGPSNGIFDPQNPKEYLKELLHSTAYCDRHMTRIQGEWFRCAYCEKDLCDNCEAMDTHDDTHFFVVFKARVDMQTFFEYFNQPDSANPRPPIAPSVYLS